MKKKLLFVNESLTLAGGEKSLIALLSNLDYSRYEVDLQLQSYGGELEKFIPASVHILPPIDYTTYVKQSWKNNLISFLKGENTQMFFSKLSYSLFLRGRKRNHNEKAMLFWKCTKDSFSVQSKQYDVAIAYAQGWPTFYVMDKIKANKKIAWVNANVQFTNYNFDFQKKYYTSFNKIITVTQGNFEHFLPIFPELKSKIEIIEDIIDAKTILKMSVLDQIDFSKNNFNILTVSRLEKGMKGLDIAIETIKHLKEKGVKFHWHFLGKGFFRPEMEIYFKENDLNDWITFHGTTFNPYPYFKAADLYVQTSRSESFGMSIAEARLLNIPIVTTRFDTVAMQMIHEKNGLITDLNPESVADGIIRMMEDKELYRSIREYLKTEQKENLESVKKFDEMIESFF